MKKISLLLFMIFTLSGCGGNSQSKTPAEPEKISSVGEISVATASAAGKKILVVYFSRTGEEYNVGKITKGNTAIVAEIIAQKTGADTFEIKPTTPYPDEYEICTELAKQELELNKRPSLAKNIDNIAQYDTIFLGYPIWWGAVPRVVITFLESNDFTGKTIIPFCTHGGSGLAGTAKEIQAICPNAKILSGLAIPGRTAQRDFATVEKQVDSWLNSL